MEPHRMADVSQAQFFEAIQQLRDQIDARHRTMRESMEIGFARLDEKLEVHAKDDLVVERRVTIIETQRAEEAKQAVKRGAWAGLIAAAGLTGVTEFIRGRFGP